MLRFLELILFLSPFLLFAAWRLGDYAGWPSSRVVAGSVLLLVLLLAGLVWFHQEGVVPPGSTYVPPALQDGHIVPGHGAPP